MAQPRIAITQDEIAEFCRKWGIVQLALFGSVLRDDFRPDSDVDTLATYAPDVKLTIGAILDMEDELSAILGRKVDLVERALVERSKNYIRRRRLICLWRRGRLLNSWGIRLKRGFLTIEPCNSLPST